MYRFRNLRTIFKLVHSRLEKNIPLDLDSDLVYRVDGFNCDVTAPQPAILLRRRKTALFSTIIFTVIILI